MDEFLFEESLLESMEILSFEERDINDIVRENAHALLDAEMDMEELLCESGLELVEEGFIDNAKAKIKTLFTKIKELIRKFIEWVKSLFKKKEEAAKNNSDEKVTSSDNSDKKSATPASDKNSDNKNGKDAKANSSNSKSSGVSNQNVKRIGVGSSGDEKAESKSNDKWKSVKVELLNIKKLRDLSNKLHNKIHEAGNDIPINQSIDDEYNSIKKILDDSYSEFEKGMETCWEVTTVDKIITINDGKYQYESVNKELLQVLEESQKSVDEIESRINGCISKVEDERNANLAYNVSRIIVGLLNKHIVLLKSAYNKDMTNRQRAFIEVRQIKKESK